MKKPLNLKESLEAKKIALDLLQQVIEEDELKLIKNNQTI